jgi:hypothetical protein
MTDKTNSTKKMLDNPFLGSLIVPIGIVLIGALIIFGVTKLLSADRSYKDLVLELQSKSFGNKWVAAYELSKQINSSQIPASDFPWLIQNLTEAYKTSVDPRTKGFIIAAVGALKSPLAKPLIEEGLKDTNTEIKFHALVALGSLPKGIDFNWALAFEILNSDDDFLKQATILSIGTHRPDVGLEKIIGQLQSSNQLVKYSSAIALINYKDDSGVPYIEEILSLTYPKSGDVVLPPALDTRQISELKLSVLQALKNNSWNRLNIASCKRFIKRVEKLAIHAHNLTICFL